MAAVERALQTAPAMEPEDRGPELQNPLARLAMLHDEARDTARLANLLGRTLPFAATLVFLAVAWIAEGAAWSFSSAIWCAFVLVATGALVLAYRRAMALPFERAPLKSFSQDLNAILMFAGVAWGSGAFLALPDSTDAGAILLFSAGTSAAAALLLRERENTMHFVAPIAALASFACVLRSMAEGALGAALVLIGCGVVAIGVMWSARRNAGPIPTSEPAGLPLS